VRAGTWALVTLPGVVFLWSGFALAAPLQVSASPEIWKGANLFHQCEAAIQQMDYPQGDSHDEVGATACVSYLQGFIDGKSADRHGPCLGNASYGEIVHAYVAFMKKHPEVMGMDKRVGVVLALGAAYPCPANGTSK
jgi:hypothetical protein